MTTLLLRLMGPLQSWGLDSRFGERVTASEPSKSGVLGLVCAALGRDRTEPIDDLSSLRMGLRVDREGLPLRDYHTALEVLSSSGEKTGTVLSNRWYLMDAAFLVGLEGESQLLKTVHAALYQPVWPISLGRKACLPGEPVWLPDGLQEGSLEASLEAYPSLVAAPEGSTRRWVLEDARGEQLRPDQPLGPFSARQFGMRRVRTEVRPCT